MTGLGRVIVGYRKHDRRRYRLEHEHGVLSVATRKCAAGCGYPVYFNASGMQTMHEKDPEVLCEECAARHRVEVEQVEL